MIELSQKRKIEEAISQAEMILIGVGEEFSPVLPEFDVEESIRPFALSRYYASLGEENETVAAYKMLRSMIGEKPYFAVTMNTDDLIYRGGFWQDLVAAPCGSMGKMQCREHIVEAAPVCTQVLAAVQENSVLGMSKAAVQENSVPGMSGAAVQENSAPGMSGAAIHENTGPVDIIRKYARCPECGAPLKFHIKSEEGYLEKGYLTQWQYYNNWLTCTLGRKLCILELGVGFQYPQVIRWPFERVAYYNQKATLIRVHSRLPQVAAELGEKGIAVKCMPVEFINEMGS